MCLLCTIYGKEWKPKMRNVTRIIHVNTPAQARDFLRSLRGPNGEVISTVGTADGRTIPLDEANDEAILEFAQTMARALGEANKKVQSS
jgi:hypothetical protein